MKNYTINNERGMAALLSVIVLSMIMVSTLTSFYVYIENRARFQERLRMNYQTGYVMEDMGRALLQTYDDGQAALLASTDCPGSSHLTWLDCNQICAQDTTLLAGTVPAGTPRYAVCVKSDNLNKIINGADYFCAFNADGGANAPSYCASLAKNDKLNFKTAVVVATNTSPPDSKIENWYGRLDHFFDTTIVKNAPVLADKMYPILESKIQPPTMLGWLLPETAYASAPTSQYANGSSGGSDCNANPDGADCKSQCSGSNRPAFCKSTDISVTLAKIGNGCTSSSTDPRCMKCAGSQRKGGANGTCMMVSICPPWIKSSECIGSNSDRRIHQMIRVK